MEEDEEHGSKWSKKERVKEADRALKREKKRERDREREIDKEKTETGRRGESTRAREGETHTVCILK